MQPDQLEAGPGLLWSQPDRPGPLALEALGLDVRPAPADPPAHLLAIQGLEPPARRLERLGADDLLNGSDSF